LQKEDKKAVIKKIAVSFILNTASEKEVDTSRNFEVKKEEGESDQKEP